MARKHIKEQVAILAKKYSEAQEMYLKISEILAESMVHPDSFEDFNNYKSCLDGSLTVVSEALNAALMDRTKFLNLIKKLKNDRDTWEKTIEAFEKGTEKTPESERLLQSYRGFLLRANNTVAIIEKANLIASLPNRKKRRCHFRKEVNLFEKVDKDLKTMRDFLEEI